VTLPRDEFITKKPLEVFDYDMDFTPDLTSGEILSTDEVKVFDSEGADVTSTILDSSSHSSMAVKAWFKAGADEKSYLAQFKVTTSRSATLVEELLIHVRSKL